MRTEVMYAKIVSKHILVVSKALHGPYSLYFITQNRHNFYQYLYTYRVSQKNCKNNEGANKGKGRHCCSVGELKITFASTCNHGCKESVFNVLFNVLFLVLDFPLGAPNTLLKHVIERSIWRIVVGEGSWWGWGFSQDW